MKRNAQALADLLNHGIMPFVGRADLLDRLVALFVGAGTDVARSERMRGAVIEGEISIGKSLLVDQFVGRIRSAEGICLQVRLLAGTPAGPLAMLGHAIGDDPIAAEILGRRRRGPDDDRDLLADIRRLCRLRRTAIVIEDLHLLSAVDASSLRALLDHLADESLLVVTLTRPIESPPLLLPTSASVDRITLPPLTDVEIAQLWPLLFDRPANPELLDPLVSISRGRPEAIRSILRRTLGVAVAEGEDLARIDPDRFVSEATTVVEELADGVAGSLNEEERRVATMLACLGEIFAVESAALLVETEQIDRLRFDGLLLSVRQALPGLPGLATDPVDYPESNEPLLRFSDSLLFEHLRTSAPILEGRELALFASLLGSGAPLFTDAPLVPILEAIIACSAGKDIPFDPTLPLLRISNILHDRCLSTTWTEAIGPVELLAQAVERCVDALQPSTIRALRTSLAFKKGLLAEQQGDEEAHVAAIEEGISLSSDPQDPRTARYRIGALVKDPSAQFDDPGFLRTIHEEVRTIIARFPPLDGSGDHAMFLCVIAMFARDLGDRALFAAIEREYERIAAGTLDGADRRRLDNWFLPILIQVADTPDEMAHRSRQYEQIRSLPRIASLAAHVLDHEIMFLYSTMRAEECLRVIERGIDLFGRRSLHSLAERAAAKRIVLRSGSGGRSEQVLQPLAQEQGDAPDQSVSIVAARALALWMIGDDRWRDGLVDTPDAVAALPAGLQQLFGDAIIPDDTPGPLLRIDDLVDRLVCCQQRIDRTKKLSTSEHDRTAQMLEDIWITLCSRRLVGWLDRPLQIAAVLLTKARVRTMQAEAAALRSDHDRATSGPPTLQVINSFALLPADRSEQRTIGGHRMKSVLALMVATALVPRNYSLEEFARLVSDEDPGDVIDLEAARNNLYVRLHALRKILPPGAIASETGEAPRIDREHLRVDLLDILARATESVDAVGAGRVVAGLELITAVLDDLGTGIPFPSLYRPLFEAARDQVDVTIRRAVLRVAEGAAALDDFLGAAALLDRAAGRFAGDDEIFERRADMLRRGGRGLEAELG